MTGALSGRARAGVARGPRDAETQPMKTATKYLTFELPRRRGLVRITDEVESFCAESGVQEGMILVSAMRTSPPRCS